MNENNKSIGKDNGLSGVLEDLHRKRGEAIAAWAETYSAGDANRAERIRGYLGHLLRQTAEVEKRCDCRFPGKDDDCDDDDCDDTWDDDDDDFEDDPVAELEAMSGLNDDGEYEWDDD